MKRMALLGSIIALFAVSASAQVTDTTGVNRTPAAAQPKRSAERKVYYGGTVGASFGNYFSFRVSPFIGYKITPALSAGIKIAYEYVEDNRYDSRATCHNYGGSVFTRFRFHPRAYAHVEFAEASYQYAVSSVSTDRTWVPFILLGGGYVQPLSARASAYVEVLVDVLQNDKSPYKDWEPWVSVGVSVGL